MDNYLVFKSVNLNGTFKNIPSYSQYLFIIFNIGLFSLSYFKFDSATHKIINNYKPMSEGFFFSFNLKQIKHLLMKRIKKKKRSISVLIDSVFRKHKSVHNVCQLQTLRLPPHCHLSHPDNLTSKV